MIHIGKTRDKNENYRFSSLYCAPSPSSLLCPLSRSGYYVLAAAMFYAIDRLVRLFWGMWPRRTLFMLEKGGGCMQVLLPRHPLAKYHVGSYVFANFPAVSLLEWHPFTLSSGPNDDYIELHIKALGDHTNRLLELVRRKEQTWVRIDGPYGHVSVNYKRYPAVVLVGGGVGVTPRKTD